MMIEEAINDLLKYADIIGKQPDKQQDVKLKNAVKIALRIGFNKGLKFRNNLIV